LLNYYEESSSPVKTKFLSPTFQFKTGIDMDLISRNTYKFTNQKSRWAGVQIDNQKPFLLEARDLLPELSISAGLSLLYDVLVMKAPEVEAKNIVRTYGSPLKIFISPVGSVAALLNSELVSSCCKIVLQEADPKFRKPGHGAV
jgi:hypothetical protein